MKCVHCGRSIKDQYAYCPFCGTDLHRVKKKPQEEISTGVKIALVVFLLLMLFAAVTNNFFIVLAMVFVVLILIAI